jgi:hypothetical protein
MNETCIVGVQEVHNYAVSMANSLLHYRSRRRQQWLLPGPDATAAHHEMRWRVYYTDKLLIELPAPQPQLMCCGARPMGRHATTPTNATLHTAGHWGQLSQQPRPTQPAA